MTGAAAADLVGRHLIVDIPGPEIDAGVEELIRDGRVGGVILFARNVRSPAQVRRLTDDLQRLAAGAGLPPLMISIDQEGGLVNRITDGVTVFPSAMAIGAAGRPEDAAAAGRITARELRALGITINHAPVCDLNSDPANPVIGVRAFGDDPAAVGRLTAAYVRAAEDAGVLTTPKHFPGHGATAVDSHADLPVVAKDARRLIEEDLLPFRDAFAGGAGGVMAAHILYPALDAAHPATLSSRVITTLLREELHFSGVAFSDAMDMKAVADRWPRGEAAVAALAAGLDVVMACGPQEAQWETIHAARTAAADGRLSLSLLLASAARIERAQSRHTPREAADAADRSSAGLAQDIADRAVTLVRNRANRIPVAAGQAAVLYLGLSAWRRAAQDLADELARQGAMPTLALDASAVAGHSWDLVIVVSAAWQYPQGTEIIMALQGEFADRLIVVGAANPYELLSLPQVDTYVAAYGPDPASMRAAAKVLVGAIEATGRLPVALPSLYPRGHRA